MAPGPSPRWRGDLAHWHAGDLRKGSIPALAGRPDRSSTTASFSRVHPRAGGATISRRRGIAIETGPSPRWRGNLKLDRRRIARRGSIPALAGQPLPSRMALATPRVHPRAGGATTICEPPGVPYEGPSPRWRGNHQQRRPLRLKRGSIPALAGQPIFPSRNSKVIRVYPRAGGATIARGGIRPSRAGPSPRWRGNRCRTSFRERGWGSIPALAGQPCTPLGLRRASRVHPRAGGATGAGRLALVIRQGPSPRWRGNRLIPGS